MNTKAPSVRGLLALFAFILSCFGITLYLWLIFGGGAPLQPKGYRMHIPFPDGSGLTPEADVRIAGVNVGKVKTINLVHGHADVEVQLDHQYAPRPADSRAILRQKTALGETYIELSAGNPADGIVHDGGSLKIGNIAETVRIDQILRTFDKDTRRAFGRWLEGQGEALLNGGPALNAAISQLEPLGRYGNDVISILRRQNGALGDLVRNGGSAISALTERRGQLRGLTTNAERVFRTIGNRDQDLADTFRVLPTFLDESRRTADRLGSFSALAAPITAQLRPGIRQLPSLLRASNSVSPDLTTLLSAIGPVTRASRLGLPALDTFLFENRKILKRIKPWLGTLIPSITYLTAYKHELTGFFANVAAATQATLPAANGSGPLHYARASVPINPETLATYPERLSSSRGNAYPRPLEYNQLASGLRVFGAYMCNGRPVPSLSPAFPADRKTEIADFYFTPNPNGPACRGQAPLAGSEGSYPRLKALP